MNAKTSKFHKTVELVNEIVIYGIDRGLGHLNTEDLELNGRTVVLNGEEKLNFSSCSYLGLELHDGLKKGAIEAIEKYGTQFSSSRTYVSLGLYKEYESLLSQMFDNAPVIVGPTTTLCHQIVMPVLIDKNDLLIYDQQVHFSVQNAMHPLRSNNTKTIILRHNDLNSLEDHLKHESRKYDKIWYCCDGVYSMYGDFAPLDELVSLMIKYPKLHLYVDDAHGMSWMGKNGTGYAFSKLGRHPKVMLVTSLNKAFASGGGLMVFPNKKIKSIVKNYGGPLTFGGPLQPANLGAGIASAKIHLDSEIYELQSAFQEKLQFNRTLVNQLNIPIVGDRNAPIIFCGIGLTKVGYNLVKKLYDDGFYVNTGIFPAVPETSTGIRYVINNHHKFDDIEQLVKSINKNIPISFAEEDRTYNDIKRAYRRIPGFKMPENMPEIPFLNIERKELNILEFDSIHDIDPYKWKRIHGESHAMNYDYLSALENIHVNHQEKEFNWKFKYFIIEDKNNEVIFSTVCTIVLCKDDVFASSHISEHLELERATNNGLLTSKTLIMGTMGSDTKNFYLKNDSDLSEKSLEIFLNRVREIQDQEDVTNIILRSFEKNEKLFEFFHKQGFIKYELPADHKLSNLKNRSYEDFLKEDIRHHKRYRIKKISKLSHLFKVEKVNQFEDISELVKLYHNVRDRNFEINTFPFPDEFFNYIQKSPDWEILKLKFIPKGNVVSVVFAHMSLNEYTFLLFGKDYDMDPSYEIYKRSLIMVIQRAIELNKDVINCGLSASLAKRKVGFLAEENFAFIQQKDDFSRNYISNLETELKGRLN